MQLIKKIAIHNEFHQKNVDDIINRIPYPVSSIHYVRTPPHSNHVCKNFSCPGHCHAGLPTPCLVNPPSLSHIPPIPETTGKSISFCKDRSNHSVTFHLRGTKMIQKMFTKVWRCVIKRTLLEFSDNGRQGMSFILRLGGAYRYCLCSDLI